MSILMRRAGWLSAAVMALLVLAALAGVARGGPLDPADPPSSTLPQIEPRIPISQLPFTITDEGSYYVTRSLSGTSGITVLSDNVTIDLNGFALVGPGGGGTAGISVPNFPTQNVIIKNGLVEFYDVGISAGAAVSSRIEGVTVRYYAANGTGVQLGSTSVLEDCIIDGIGTAGTGVNLGARSVIRECSVIGNRFEGVRAFESAIVEHNQIVDNGSFSVAYDGIYVAQDDVTIRNNHLANAGGRDIRIGSGTRATIANNVLSNCTSITISVGFAAVVFGPLQGQANSNVTHSQGYCP